MFNVIVDGTAIGDGIANDTVALQAALDNNRHVYLPEGTYLITAPLTVSHQSQTLEGAGFESKIQADEITAIRVVPAVGEPGGMLLRNFSIVGEPAYGIVIDLDDVNSTYLRESVIEHIKCSQTEFACIKLLNASKTDGYFTSSIRDCYLRGGIELNRAGDSLHIERNTITGENNGIVVSFVPGAALCNIRDNSVTSEDYGLIVNDAPFRLHVERNHFEKWQASSTLTDYVVLLNGHPQMRGTDCYLANNSINPLGNAVYGIAVHQMDRTYINHNRILDGTGNVAMYITPLAVDTILGPRNILGAVVDQGTNTIWE